MHLFSNQREPCRRTLEEFTKKYGSFTEAKLIDAALHVRSKELQKALAILKDDPSKEAKLTVVQVLLDEGLCAVYPFIIPFLFSIRSVAFCKIDNGMKSFAFGSHYNQYN